MVIIKHMVVKKDIQVYVLIIDISERTIKVIGGIQLHLISQHGGIQLS